MASKKLKNSTIFKNFMELLKALRLAYAREHGISNKKYKIFVGIRSKKTKEEILKNGITYFDEKLAYSELSKAIKTFPVDIEDSELVISGYIKGAINNIKQKNLNRIIAVAYKSEREEEAKKKACSIAVRYPYYIYHLLTIDVKRNRTDVEKKVFDYLKKQYGDTYVLELDIKNDIYWPYESDNILLFGSIPPEAIANVYKCSRVVNATMSNREEQTTGENDLKIVLVDEGEKDLVNDYMEAINIQATSYIQIALHVIGTIAALSMIESDADQYDKNALIGAEYDLYDIVSYNVAKYMLFNLHKKLHYDIFYAPMSKLSGGPLNIIKSNEEGYYTEKLPLFTNLILRISQDFFDRTYKKILKSGNINYMTIVKEDKGLINTLNNIKIEDTSLLELISDEVSKPIYNTLINYPEIIHNLFSLYKYDTALTSMLKVIWLLSDIVNIIDYRYHELYVYSDRLRSMYNAMFLHSVNSKRNSLSKREISWLIDSLRVKIKTVITSLSNNFDIELINTEYSEEEDPLLYILKNANSSVKCFYYNLLTNVYEGMHNLKPEKFSTCKSVKTIKFNIDIKKEIIKAIIRLNNISNSKKKRDYLSKSLKQERDIINEIKDGIHTLFSNYEITENDIIGVTLGKQINNIGKKYLAYQNKLDEIARSGKTRDKGVKEWREFEAGLRKAFSDYLSNRESLTTYAILKTVNDVMVKLLNKLSK